ncbi:erythroblast NAD(P)(+)--arginine ADP-ribosyltransferase-like [Spea bombifrons]|uniref:erythroblast NAD(P)(+)--arginine ADP-ribosyltransferase-like n=1 Tax=Spea bombifrons TaxID=233779 RepID=UPI002349B41C|nr:erythroblast NAD(P)(+)--arginine ADP-ribosyltransferase-like [Spea bombifrons]
MWTRNPATSLAHVVIVLSAASLAFANTVGVRLKSERNVLSSKETALDMALSSYDDQYNGCSDIMEAEIHQLFQTEYSLNKEFAEGWDIASLKWNERKKSVEVPRGFNDEYAIALFAYTMNGPLHKTFNEAVRKAGQSRQYYLNNFNFKVLHYYLTKALQVLDSVETPNCHKVFRGIRGVRFQTDTRKPIRFGQFTSSSVNDQSALLFGEDTFFNIQTCYGVNIRNFSFFPGEEEVLIPPFEKFKVTQFTKEKEKNVINLQSLEKSSVYNCEFVKERRCKSRDCRFNSATGLQMKICSPAMVLAALLVVMMSLCD